MTISQYGKEVIECLAEQLQFYGYLKNWVTQKDISKYLKMAYKQGWEDGKKEALKPDAAIIARGKYESFT